MYEWVFIYPFFYSASILEKLLIISLTVFSSVFLDTKGLSRSTAHIRKKTLRNHSIKLTVNYIQSQYA